MSSGFITLTEKSLMSLIINPIKPVCLPSYNWFYDFFVSFSINFTMMYLCIAFFVFIIFFFLMLPEPTAWSLLPVWKIRSHNLFNYFSALLFFPLLVLITHFVEYFAISPINVLVIFFIFFLSFVSLYFILYIFFWLIFHVTFCD